MQYFKGDGIELKYIAATEPIMNPVGVSLNDFYNNAFGCYVLGDVIWDSKRSPLANAIPKNIFRESFAEIYETFLEAGSFEGYISVFKKIFGESSGITFTIPGPGKLNILIEADQIVIENLIERHIVDNDWVFDELINDEGDNIAVRSVKGMSSQYDVEQMLFELVPNGIYTEITLTVGI